VPISGKPEIGFLIVAGVAVAGGAVIWVFDRPLRVALRRGA